jgi:hypothetical protein
MKQGNMDWVQTNTDAPRAGHVYLVRGFIGLFSFGIDRLTNEIEASGVRSHVFQEDQHKTLSDTIVQAYRANKDHEPICLIGHSLGANDVIEIAQALDKQGVPVDMLVTIDATEYRDVPKNVAVCYNYYQPSIFDGTGILRGIPLKQEPGSTGKLYNYNIRKERSDLMEWDTTHVNIDKNEKIHREVIAHLQEACPPRAQWLAMKNGNPMLAAARIDPSRPSAAPALHSAALTPRVSQITGNAAETGAPRK